MPGIFLEELSASSYGGRQRSISVCTWSIALPENLCGQDLTDQHKVMRLDSTDKRLT
jgi:hypothetical protein